MICPECKIKMVDIKRKGGFHKNTKYICPECKFVKFVKNSRNKK